MTKLKKIYFGLLTFFRVGCFTDNLYELNQVFCIEKVDFFRLTEKWLTIVTFVKFLHVLNLRRLGYTKSKNINLKIQKKFFFYF